MYKLYSIAGSCSLGIHALLNALEQDVDIIMRDQVDNYNTINPTNAVPVLEDQGAHIYEGGAIALYLLEKHQSPMLPPEPLARSQFLQQLFYNYATLHPAYSKLFFAMRHLQGEAQQQCYQAAAKDISRLWAVVNQSLQNRPFLGGDAPSINDYLIAVYANWGSLFEESIELGAQVERVIRQVIELPAFATALEREGITYRAVA